MKLGFTTCYSWTIPTVVAITFIWIGGCNQSNDKPLSDVQSEEMPITLNIGKSTTPNCPLEVVPVVRVDKASEMDVQFYVANNSSNSIGYWKSWVHMGHTWHWELIDCKTGKAIVERPNVTSTVPTKDDVQMLAPGESILCKISLRDYLGNIPTGRYEFRVYYSIQENHILAQLGCVPDEFDRTIMLVEVVE